MKFSLILALAAALSAQDKKIDVERSTITIHVGKAGLLSAAGHDHWINAPISSGTFNDSADAPRVEFRVEAAKMKVKPDPKVGAKDEATIQKDMEEMTLEIAKYPEITFRSTRVEKLGEAQWKVEGTLALHGVSKPVTVTVKRNSEAYTGHIVLKQTDFSIKPISVGGGLVKIKNEIELDFQIYGQPA